MGKVDAAIYPLAKKKTSYEFLREKAHLRPRTNTIGAHTVVKYRQCSLSDTWSGQRVLHLGWEIQFFRTCNNPALKRENWIVHLPINRRCESHLSPVYCIGSIRSWVWCDAVSILPYRDSGSDPQLSGSGHTRLLPTERLLVYTDSHHHML